MENQSTVRMKRWLLAFPPDVFRGSREMRGKRFNAKPERFIRFIKKGKQNSDPKITASFLVFYH